MEAPYLRENYLLAHAGRKHLLMILFDPLCECAGGTASDVGSSSLYHLQHTNITQRTELGIKEITPDAEIAPTTEKIGDTFGTIERTLFFLKATLSRNLEAPATFIFSCSSGARSGLRNDGKYTRDLLAVFF